MVRRENRTRNDDTLGPVWFEGTPQGQSLPVPRERARWDELVTRYYQLRGWDPKSGRPTKAKLEALGMRNIARNMI